MKTYEATVRLGPGNSTKVQIQATNQTDAVRKLEAQYGKGAVHNNYAMELRWMAIAAGLIVALFLFLGGHLLGAGVILGLANAGAL